MKLPPCQAQHGAVDIYGKKDYIMIMTKTLEIKDIADLCGRTIDRVRHWLTEKKLGDYGTLEDRRWIFEADDFKRFLEEEGVHFLTVAEYKNILEALDGVET